MQKENKGITLVALVITIAIMLILAGVTISVSLKGGLFSRANEATSQMQIEAEKEQLLTATLGALGTNGRVNFNDLDSNLPDNFTKISEGKYESSTGNRYQVTEDADITLLDGLEEEPDTPVTPPTINEEPNPSNSNLNETATGLVNASIWTNGAGTQDNPYLIESKENLAYLAKQVNLGNKYTNVYFRLDMDMDFEDFGELWIPIGNTSNTYFDGNFNGEARCISNIETSKNYNYRGLFGYTGPNSSILNLTVQYSNFEDNDSITKGEFVGGIVGYNKGIIENCQVIESTIMGNNYVGGIVGYNDGNIINCGFYSSSIDGTNYLGGIAGYNNGNMENISVEAGAITGAGYIGGITGLNNNSIINCSANGLYIIGNQFVDGIAGVDNGTCTGYYAWWYDDVDEYEKSDY